jgi:Amt family ammonium transporter
VVGSLLTGVFAAVSLGGSGFTVQTSIAAQVGVQALGVVVAAAWCALTTWLILKLMDLLVGVRVSEEKETEGLDLAEHGERGYSP